MVSGFKKAEAKGLLHKSFIEVEGCARKTIIAGDENGYFLVKYSSSAADASGKYNLFVFDDDFGHNHYATDLKDQVMKDVSEVLKSDSIESVWLTNSLDKDFATKCLSKITDSNQLSRFVFWVDRFMGKPEDDSERGQSGNKIHSLLEDSSVNIDNIYWYTRGLTDLTSNGLQKINKKAIDKMGATGQCIADVRNKLKLYNVKEFLEELRPKTVFELYQDCCDSADKDDRIHAFAHDILETKTSEHVKKLTSWLSSEGSGQASPCTTSLKGLFIATASNNTAAYGGKVYPVKTEYLKSAINKLGFKDFLLKSSSGGGSIDYENEVGEWYFPFSPGIAFLESLKQFVNSTTNDINGNSDKTGRKAPSLQFFQTAHPDSKKIMTMVVIYFNAGYGNLKSDFRDSTKNGKSVQALRNLLQGKSEVPENYKDNWWVPLFSGTTDNEFAGICWKEKSVEIFWTASPANDDDGNADKSQNGSNDPAFAYFDHTRVAKKNDGHLGGKLRSIYSTVESANSDLHHHLTFVHASDEDWIGFVKKAQEGQVLVRTSSQELSGSEYKNIVTEQSAVILHLRKPHDKLNGKEWIDIVSVLSKEGVAEKIASGEYNHEADKLRSYFDSDSTEHLQALSVLCQGYLAVHDNSESDVIKKALEKMKWNPDDKDASFRQELTEPLRTKGAARTELIAKVKSKDYWAPIADIPDFEEKLKQEAHGKDLPESISALVGKIKDSGNLDPETIANAYIDLVPLLTPTD